MEPLPEYTPKQASYKEKAAIRWNVNDLLAWIKDKRPDLLDNDGSEKLRKAETSGEVFLACAGNREFYRNDCKLPLGTAAVLANLSRELAEEEAAGIQRNRHQAEDVEMFDAADMKSPRRVYDAFKAGIPYKPPRPLLNTSGVNWVFQPHPELYKIIAPNVLEHYTRYKKNQADKVYVPIYFYLGGAGTGKSRHGSEFASSVQQAITLHTEHKLYPELAQRLKTAFVFHVSFENETFLTDEEKSKPWNAVGVRMLRQLLGGNIERIRRKYVATPCDVFRLVAAAENVDLYNDFTGILVVDGIQRVITWDGDGTSNDSVFYGLLRQIGDLSLMSRHPSETEEGKLRQTPFILTCVTATYLGFARQYFMDSHRKHVYLPLNRLDVPTWKDDNSEVLNDDPGTRLLVNDVGGHAGAIETIAEELAQYRNRSQPNITELANAILFKLEDRYHEVISMMGEDLLPVVPIILSRQPVRLQSSIPGSDLRLGHITAPGLLWFEKAEEAYDSQYSYGAWGYLVAPYIWLWLLARSLPPRNTERLCRLLKEWEFNDYQQLLHLQTSKGHAGKTTWQNFETFCCYFRILRSSGFSDREEVEFRCLHSGCKKLRDDKEAVVVNRRLDYAEAAHQYSTKATSAKDIVTKDIGTLDAEKQLSHVILNAPSASAGDFFLSIQTDSAPFTPFRSKIVREVGRCKFVKKKLNAETYTEERNKAAGPDDFFILYTTTDAPDDIALPDRSGLVDQSCWMSYFGPFAGRAFIASQYVSSQVEEP
ncbi:uncharacterized protein Z518_03175 [Rhinocladiella mackenziei CBS 650.93]|uniref:Uncharacterized protein n=1 Tax=Rhinocladiella mackenziei CBS 650.93 TaxID=1442369 RepID=A0A0D2IRF0_9EURO|nr:uncharacterized protein Z518_03175 [Rhinocladiella mackenziei CBS 650.93]KIX08519.1 hypothetical protein Z518_03175 [Rhinocladiella mackenziei CBS 650.93]